MCVTLYASSFQPCHVVILEFVLPLLIKNKVVGPEAQRALEAMRALVKPAQLSPYERGELEMLRRAFQGMDQRPPETSK